MRKISGNRYLAEALRSYGVDYFFHMPALLMPAFAEMHGMGITLLSAHSEKAAAYMADGYSRVSNKVSVVGAQYVGAANLAAGLQDPWLGRSPVLAMTGGPARGLRNKHVYQEIDALQMYDAVTKFNVSVESVNRLPDLLRQAFRAATTGVPGPVHLEIPGHLADLDGEFTLDGGLPVSEARFASFPAFRPEPDMVAVREAVELLKAARRPIIVAGGGVTASGGERALQEFAELMKIPVATSLNGKGAIPERHELACGVVGTYPRMSANHTVNEADVVFFAGAQAGSQVTNMWKSPVPGATKVIQLNIDPAELGRNYPNDVSLLGDARTTLQRMIEVAEPVGGRDEWLGRAKQLADDWRRDNEPRMSSGATPIRPERLVREIENTLPDDGIFVVDTGHAGMWAAAMFDIKPGQKFLRAAGSLGWGYPASLGAKCAAPDRPVVCFTGDGGFYYHLSELETALRYGINTVTVVNNNHSHNQEYGSMNRAYKGNQTPDAIRMWQFDKRVNFADIAKGFGCEGIRVEDPGDVADALKHALSLDKPVVVDVLTDIKAMADRP
ncbi:thiamine pyrophosphate-binding protein [Aquibium sp. LZ166]|uniref:Thiamine pyrophosphate-binding protein n=1 Tax=Aquibium pacificus TaxID=3153579 RepID=A0ABV3SS04_9HYPH